MKRCNRGFKIIRFRTLWYDGWPPAHMPVSPSAHSIHLRFGPRSHCFTFIWIWNPDVSTAQSLWAHHTVIISPFKLNPSKLQKAYHFQLMVVSSYTGCILWSVANCNFPCLNVRIMMIDVLAFDQDWLHLGRYFHHILFPDMVFYIDVAHYIYLAVKYFFKYNSDTKRQLSFK